MPSQDWAGEWLLRTPDMAFLVSHNSGITDCMAGSIQQWQKINTVSGNSFLQWLGIFWHHKRGSSNGTQAMTYTWQHSQS